MNINKFTNSLDNTPLHSSVFADAASSSQEGMRRPQSFEQRLRIERNRQSVGRYHESMLANGHHRNMNYQRMSDSVAPSRSDTEPASRSEASSRFGGRPTGGAINSVARPVVRTNFTEPPTRGYNPYQ